jgi:competence protein ComEA
MAATRNRPSEPTSSHWVLRRADQAAAAAFVLLGLAATFGWWLSQGGWRGRLIEVDTAPPQTATFQLDVNEAEWPELAELPGIGRTLAERIVENRRVQGPFVDHEDLRRVRGIGPKTLDRIRPHLRPMPEGRSLAGK